MHIESIYIVFYTKMVSSFLMLYNGSQEL